ncbi:unnamed protein product [Thelazia callipaeda]|uniref:UPF0235 protein n=1 Tax=Thelazia callipaeda TaxID=103827 RepID=A0A0N5CK95_THECL|nr:unnamed protein product [Thelazia callipaeda]
MILIISYIGANEIGIAIAVPPCDGKANETLLHAMMNILKLRRNEIAFETGVRSRSKILRVTSKRLTMEEIREKLEKNVSSK